MSGLIQILDELVAAGERDHAPHLWRLVAETVRARFDPGDAAVVAAWFDRLAAGDAAEDVFPRVRAGRPRGKTKPRKPLKGGRIPDDVDVAWIVRDAVRAGVKPAEAKRKVAEAFDMNVRTVSNIYARLKDQLG